MQNNNQHSNDANSPYNIRAATAADIDVLKKIEAEVFTDSWSRDSIASLFEHAHDITFIAYQDENAIGYIAGSHVRGEAEIARLAVLLKARRQGIASALLLALFEELEKEDVVKISLEVRVSNEIGFSFYRKFGFSVRGRRPHYYEDGEDALVMVKGELEEN